MNTKSATKKIFPALLTAIFLMSGTTIAFSQDVYEADEVNNTEVENFSEWDSDADGLWNNNEFTSWYNDAGITNGMDTNEDGLYDDRETGYGLFNQWDSDADGYLNDDEYAVGNSAWEEEYGDHFDAWDANDDNLLDAEEYTAGLSDSGLYGDWDTDGDGLYSDEEVNEGLFNSYDTDDDGFVSDDEYNEVGFDSDFND